MQLNLLFLLMVVPLMFSLLNSFFVNILFSGFLYLLQTYILLSCIYLFLPAIILLLFFPKIKKMFKAGPEKAEAEMKTSFILLIPAHNEEKLLPDLLESIHLQNYPAHFFQTVVIADNCNDQTAAIAAKAGVTLFERFTAEASNKSQALLYATEKLNSIPDFDTKVICIIDADCKLVFNYLSELNKIFSKPKAAPVIQSYRYVSNASDTSVTTLDAAAEALRQWVVSGTRRFLGLDNFIHGLGCAMRGSVFAELMKLSEYSLAEDKDWKAYLMERRVKVDFCPKAGLSYEVVSDNKSFQKQRNRWLSGHFDTAKRYGFKMLIQSIKRGSLSQFDFACSLLQPPRSVLLIATVLFGISSFWFYEFSLVPIWVWWTMVLGFLVYGMIGLWLINAKPKQYLVLFSGIQLVVGIFKTIFFILIGKGVKTWDATRKRNL